jgi:hypothetical protein
MPPERHISQIKNGHSASQKLCLACVQLLYFLPHDCDLEHLLIFVVMNMEQKHMTITLWGQQSNQEMRFTMHVADGDNNILTVKGASQLNAMMGQLEVGSVVHLEITFTDVFPNWIRWSGKSGASFVSYNFVGTMEIDSKLEGRPKSCLEVVRISSQASVYMDDINSGSDASYSAVMESNITAERENCTQVGHHLCFMNGVHFVICITQAFPVKRLGLIWLTNEYPFMMMPISEMDISRKCSMIYWWYMVNVYLVRYW